jgi:hypothetical protein
MQPEQERHAATAAAVPGRSTVNHRAQGSLVHCDSPGVHHGGGGCGGFVSSHVEGVHAVLHPAQYERGTTVYSCTARQCRVCAW